VSILLIYTGGTIGMVKNSEGTLVPFSLDNVLTYCPELKDRLQADDLKCISTEPIKDSSNITPKDWLILRDVVLENHQGHDNILILHGSDTMAYTSSALSFLLLSFDKNVIFTGAQQPISEENSDGKFNLLDSLLLLDELKRNDINGQTLLNFGGKTFLGNCVSKSSTELFDAFGGTEYNVQETQESQLNSDSQVSFDEVKTIETNIRLVKMYPGIEINKLISGLLTDSPKGIVFESFGSGNMPENNELIAGLTKLVGQGVIVLNISQCQEGSVDMNTYQTGKQLLKIGVLDGKNLTTESALTKLMLLLSVPEVDISKLIVTSIAGEFTK
jgi:L-asparaginase